MNTLNIISHYYKPDSTACKILISHSRLVTKKAVEIAKTVPFLNPDIDFIKEAAMLHDIGIFKTKAPEIGCNGKHPYIFHGFLGREILETQGLYKHALVAERHTGAGISKKNIIENRLKLPERDMLPVSTEEIIICYADKFFSKKPESFEKEKSFDEIIMLLSQNGKEQADRFICWAKALGSIPA